MSDVDSVALAAEQGPPAARGSWLHSGWLRFAVSRTIGVIATLAGLMVVTFLIVHLIPGDPARNVVGINASTAQVARARHQLGLDQPLPIQFAMYVWNTFHGDLGVSFTQHEPVRMIITQRLPFTAALAGAGLLIALGIGMPAGMIAAVIGRGGRHAWFTTGFIAVTTVGGAIPQYVAGTALVFIFSLAFRLLPAGGSSSFASIILPAFAVGLGAAAVFARIMRNEVESMWSQEFIVAASSKRLPSSVLYLRHILPNVLTSTLSLGGLILVSLLGGTVVVENVFAWPGLGSEIVSAIEQSDYPTIQAIILMLGILAVVINLVVDLALATLDPRTTLGRR